MSVTTTSVGTALSRVDGRVKVTGQAQYAVRAADRGRRLRRAGARDDRRRGDRRDRSRAGARAPRRPRGASPTTTPRASARRPTPSCCSSRTTPSTTAARSSPRSSPRRSSRRARPPPGPHRLRPPRPRRRAPHHPPAPLQAGQGQPLVRHRHGAGRRGESPAKRRGHRRPHLRHRPHPQQRDGAARHPGRLGGRRSPDPRLDPGHLRRAPDPRRGLRARPQARARRRPARRRRFRLQGHAATAVVLAAIAAQLVEPPRQGRADPPADVRQRRLPHADHPARPPRRRPRTAASPRSPTRRSSRPRRCASSPSRPARPRA